MTIAELCAGLQTPARRKAIARLAGSHRATMAGLAGSSAAVMLAALPQQKNTVVVVGDDADDAGYLFFDLCRLFPE